MFVEFVVFRLALDRPDTNFGLDILTDHVVNDVTVSAVASSRTSRWGIACVKFQF